MCLSMLKMFLVLAKFMRASDLPMREAKRRKVAVDEQFEDLPQETVAEIIATIDDPNYMIGPDVRAIFPINLYQLCFIQLFLDGIL